MYHLLYCSVWRLWHMFTQFDSLWLLRSCEMRQQSFLIEQNTWLRIRQPVKKFFLFVLFDHLLLKRSHCLLIRNRNYFHFKFSLIINSNDRWLFCFGDNEFLNHNWNPTPVLNHLIIAPFIIIEDSNFIRCHIKAYSQNKFRI